VRGVSPAFVTIVEFSIPVPVLQRAEATLERIRREYPNTVRIVWKDEPLSSTCAPSPPRRSRAPRWPNEAKRASGTSTIGSSIRSRSSKTPISRTSHVRESSTSRAR